MDELEKLRKENDELKDKLIDLAFEMNYNKQTELLEYLRSLYESVKDKQLSKLSKKQILNNLRDSIEEFAKDNKIAL